MGSVMSRSVDFSRFGLTITKYAHHHSCFSAGYRGAYTVCVILLLSRVHTFSRFFAKHQNEEVLMIIVVLHRF